MNSKRTFVEIAAAMAVGAFALWAWTSRPQRADGTIVTADFAKEFGRPFLECPINAATAVGNIGSGQCSKWTYTVSAADNRSNVREIALDLEFWVDGQGVFNGLAVRPTLENSTPSSVFEIYIAVGPDDRDLEPGRPRSLALRIAVACRECLKNCEDRIVVGAIQNWPSNALVANTRGVGEYYDELYVINIAKLKSEEYASSFGIRDTYFRFSRQAAATLTPCP